MSKMILLKLQLVSSIFALVAVMSCKGSFSVKSPGGDETTSTGGTKSKGGKDGGDDSGAFVINSSDPDYTSSAVLTITITDDDGVTEYRIGIGEDCSSASWNKYSSAAISYQLPSGDGEKTLCMEVRNKDKEVTDLGTNKIILDTTPPNSFVSTTSPIDANTYSGATMVFYGTASDAGSGLSAIEVKVKNSTSGLYLNQAKTAFDSADAVWHQASGSNPWSFEMNDSVFSHAVVYQVTPRATDKGGLVQTSYTSSNITWSSGGPLFTSLALANDAANGYVNLAESATANALGGTLTASSYTSADYKLVTSATTCNVALTYGAMPASNSADFGADGTYKICVRLTDASANIAYGASSTFTLDKTVPAFTSLALANDASNGYINGSENANTSDLASTLVATGYDSVQYKLVTSATTCNVALVYGTMPKSNAAEFIGIGNYKVCVELADSAGNPTAYGASGVIAFDTAAPTFTSVALAGDAAGGYINLAETANTNDLADTLVAANYDSVTYKLAASATTCDGALTYGVMPKSNSGDFGSDGNYKVCVKLADNAGNVTYGNSSAIALDKTVPAFTSLARANEAADGYINALDSVAINDLGSTLVAAGQDTSAYKLVTTATTCDVALTYGTMPLANTGDFTGAGTFKICVKLTDNAGNPAAYGASGNIVYDVTAPTFTSLALANDAANSYVNLAETANTNDLGDTLVAANYDAVTYKLALTATTCNGSLTYGTMPKSNSADFSADGSYRICVKLSDDAGNVTYGNSNSVALDKTVPAFTSIALANEAADGNINAADFATTNALADTLVGSGYDTAAYKLITSATTCDVALTYGAMPASNSADFTGIGTFKVCVKLTDNAGNPAAYGATSNITFNNTAPTFTSLALANDAANSYVNLAETANTNDLGDTLVAANYATAEYKLATAATTCNVALTYGTMPKSNSGDFGADGSYKICVKLTDASSNVTYGASSNFTLDKTVPAFTSLARANDAANGYINAAENATSNDLGDTLVATGYDTAAYKLIASGTTCDVALTYGAMPKSDSTDFTGAGTFKICVKLTDNAGNPAAYGASSNITFDITAPTFTSLALAGDAANSYVNLAETSNTNDLGDTLVGANYDAAAYKLATSATTCDVNLTYGTMPKSNSGDFSADGSYKICVKLTDNAGNAAYGNSNAITLDKTVPAFTSMLLAGDALGGYLNTTERAATNDMAGAITGSGYDTATYKLATSATTCDNALTYGANPKSNSGDFGVDGSYKICVKVSDTAGNPDAYGASGAIVLDTAAPGFTSLALAGDAANSYVNASENAATNDLASTLVATDYDTAAYKLVTSATTCDVNLTYGTMPKSNSGDFGADGTYKVCVKLTDNAANTAAYGATSNFTFDVTLPSSTVTTNGTKGPSSTADTDTQFAGTGTDATAGVASVSVSFQSGANSNYLNTNKDAFDSATAVWHAATGTTAWTIDIADSLFANAVTYTVRARVTDSAGNVQTAFGSNTITWDGTAPSAATTVVVTPGFKQNSLTWADGGGASGYIVVRRPTSAVNWTPTAGTTYTTASALANSNSIEYVGTSTSLTDDDGGALLANGTTYHYAIYAYDAYLNYAAAATGSGAPVNNAPVLDTTYSLVIDTAGGAMTSVNAADEGGDDSDADGQALTYTCYYDTTRDGAVAETTQCSQANISNGTAFAFSASTAVISGWDPTSAVNYEFKIKACDGDAGDPKCDTEIFNVTTKATALSTAGHFVKVESGNGYSCALTNTGKPYCWGKNVNHQLGDNTTVNRSSPTEVVLTNVTGEKAFADISIGNVSSCGLTAEGVAYCWGSNLQGAVGDNSVLERNLPTAVDTSAITGGEDTSFVRVSSAGDKHTCGINGDGVSYCWGAQDNGRLGNNSTVVANVLRPTTAQKVTGGYTWRNIWSGGVASCGVDISGVGYCWGLGANHAVCRADGTTTDQGAPTAVDVTNLAEDSMLAVVPAYNSANGGGVMILTSEGKLYGCGSRTSDNGYLGVNTSGTVTALADPTAVVLTNVSETSWRALPGSYHNTSNCGVTVKGEAHCWGLNAYGSIGDNSLTTRHLPVDLDLTNVTAPQKFLTIENGNQNTCAITLDGKLYCAGRHLYGNVGNGAAAQDTTPYQQLTAVDTTVFNDAAGYAIIRPKFVQLATGSSHSCGVTSGGEIWCWGSDASGQLGASAGNDNSQYPVKVSSSEYFIQVVVGTSHSCGLTGQGAAYCWGSDAAGQLGAGATDQTSQTPVAVSQSGLTGDDAFTMLAAGGTTTCGISSEGLGYCWGSDANGQVGNGATTGDQHSPVAILTTGMDAGRTTLLQVAVGNLHACALAWDGDAYCWGEGSNGEIGNAASSDVTTPTKVSAGAKFFTEIASGGSHSCGIVGDETVWCWGENGSGQLGDNSGTDRNAPVQANATTLPAAINITIGGAHTCAIRSNGDVYCWGSDAQDQLGTNGGGDADEPAAITYTDVTAGDRAFKYVAAGNEHTCGITGAGLVYCWGSDSSGKLGNGFADGSKALPEPLTW